MANTSPFHRLKKDDRIHSKENYHAIRVLEKAGAIVIALLTASFFLVPPIIGGPHANWESALQHVLTSHGTIGKDFVFFYGPLGLLATRSVGNISVVWFWLFDAFLLAHVYLLTRLAFDRAGFQNVAKVILLALLVCRLEIISLIIILQIGFLFEFLLSKKVKWIPSLAALSLVAFFTAPAAGMLTAIFLITGLGHAVYARAISLRKAIFFLAGTVLFAVAGIVLFHIDAIGYIYYGVSLNGFSTALPIPRDHFNQWVPVAAGALCLILIIVPPLRSLRRQNATVYFVVVITSILLFKSAFAASNDKLFFGWITVLAALLALYSRTNLYYASLLPVALICFFFTVNLNGLGKLNYLHRIANYATGIHRTPLPAIPTVDGSIDLFPGDSLHESLNFKPRPVPASPLAYTRALDELNANFIHDQGPEFIQYDHRLPHNHYPLFHEVRSKLEILRNYRTLSEQTDNVPLMLIRRNKPALMDIRQEEPKSFSWDEEISLLPTRELQVARISFRHSFAGWLLSLLSWSPDLSVELILDDGASQHLRVSKSSAAAGIFINRFVTDRWPAIFFNHFGRLDPNVRAVRFSTSNSWLFQSSFDMAIDLIRLDGETAPPDSSWFPLSTNRPEEITASAITANLEDFIVGQDRLSARGWAFSSDPTAELYLLLEQEKTCYLFPVTKSYRPDVKAIHGTHTPDSSGFNTVVFRDVIKPGLYSVGLALVREKEITDLKIFEGIILNHSEGSMHYGIPLQKTARRPTAPSDDFTLSMDLKKTTESTLQLAGWALYTKEQHALTDSLFVVLTSRDGSMFRAKIPRATRKDVSDHFANAQLDDAGFAGTFSTRSIPKGRYELGIELRKGGQVTYKEMDHLYLGYPGVFTAVPKTDTPATTDMTWMFDQFIDRGDILTLSGWAFTEEKNTRHCEYTIVVQSDEAQYVSAVLGVQRPDVATHFNTPNLINCGFELVVSKKGLKNGKYRVGIEVKCTGDQPRVTWTDQYVEK